MQICIFVHSCILSPYNSASYLANICCLRENVCTYMFMSRMVPWLYHSSGKKRRPGRWPVRICQISAWSVLDPRSQWTPTGQSVPRCGWVVTGRKVRQVRGSYLSWTSLAAERPGSHLLSRGVAEYTWVTNDPFGWHRRSGSPQLIRQQGWDCPLKEDNVEHRTVSKILQSGLHMEGG